MKDLRRVPFELHAAGCVAAAQLAERNALTAFGWQKAHWNKRAQFWRDKQLEAIALAGKEGSVKHGKEVGE